MTGVSRDFFHALPPPSTGKNAGNTRDFMLYFNTLIMLRSLQKIHRYSLTLYEQTFWKKIGSYHSKNIVLGFEKPLLGEKSAQEEVFRGLKQRYLSGMTQFFFKKSVHKGLNYIYEFTYTSSHPLPQAIFTQIFKSLKPCALKQLLIRK